MSFTLKNMADYKGMILGAHQTGEGTWEVSPIEINAEGYMVVDTSNYPISGKRSNGELMPVMVDKYGHLINIDIIHYYIHIGKMMRVVYTFQDVPNDGVVRIHHRSGATKYVHSQLEVESIGRWRFQTYGNSTYSINGTVVNSFNRKSDTVYVPEVIFYHTPTVNVLGSPRIDEYFGSGITASTRSTGTISDRIESVFAPTHDALVVLTNLSNAAQDVTVSFDFYEDVE